MQARVRWKTPFTLIANTLSNAESGYASKDAPQLAPALFTSTCSAGSRPASAVATARQPSSVPQSPGSERQVPLFESSAATSSHIDALREET